MSTSLMCDLQKISVADSFVVRCTASENLKKKILLGKKIRTSENTNFVYYYEKFPCLARLEREEELEKRAVSSPSPKFSYSSSNLFFGTLVYYACLF